MQVIGFNFTKFFAERKTDLVQYSTSTNIEFTNLEKEKIEIIKDLEALKISFQYMVTYSDTKKKEEEKFGEIIIEGNVVMALSKDEEKELQKSWKNKKISNETKVPLFNLILKKCSPKSIGLADDIFLPSPIPIPKITPKQD